MKRISIVLVVLVLVVIMARVSAANEDIQLSSSVDDNHVLVGKTKNGTIQALFIGLIRRGDNLTDDQLKDYVAKNLSIWCRGGADLVNMNLDCTLSAVKDQKAKFDCILANSPAKDELLNMYKTCMIYASAGSKEETSWTNASQEAWDARTTELELAKIIKEVDFAQLAANTPAQTKKPGAGLWNSLVESAGNTTASQQTQTDQGDQKKAEDNSINVGKTYDESGACSLVAGASSNPSCIVFLALAALPMIRRRT